MALFQDLLSFLPFISSSLFFPYTFTPVLSSIQNGPASFSIVFFFSSASCLLCSVPHPDLLVPFLSLAPISLPPSSITAPFPPHPASREGICSSHEWLEVGTEKARLHLRSHPAPSSEILDECLPSFEGQRLDTYHFLLQGLH